MQLRLRSSLLGVALLAGALAPLAAPGVACAASSAALVIDTGSDTYTYCVELGGSSVDGIELIQRAGSQHGLQYKLGYGGKAVCMLANVGAAGSDCFGEHPYFWGYWRGDSSGGWSWSGTGAAGVTVAAGDVNGWSWGTGDSGSSHPAPPPTTHESVCGAQPGPSPKPDRPKGGGSPRPGGSERTGDGSTAGAGGAGASGGGESTTASTGSATGKEEGKKQRPRATDEMRTRDAEKAKLPAAATPSPIETPLSSSNAAGAAAPESRPPVAGFVALGVTAALGVLGAVIVRRRRFDESP